MDVAASCGNERWGPWVFCQWCSGLWDGIDGMDVLERAMALIGSRLMLFGFFFSIR